MTDLEKIKVHIMDQIIKSYEYEYSFSNLIEKDTNKAFNLNLGCRECLKALLKYIDEIESEV